MLRSHSFSLLLLSSLIMGSAGISYAADDEVVAPPAHDSSKANERVEPASDHDEEGEEVSVKDALVPDNIGKNVQIRTYLRKKDKAEISEYSLHGKVYMVKVQPAGDMPAYYLYDENGDGTFAKRLPGNYKPLNPPVWVIKKF